MIISKSKYVRGINCPKAMWLKEYRPETAEAAEDTTRAEEGTRFGKLAQDLYGPHETVPFSPDLDGMVRTTRELLDKGVPVICEASFRCDDAFCSVDLLINRGNRRTDIVEVKMTAGIEPEFIDDTAFQASVLIRNGYEVGKLILAHANTRYIRQGDLDIRQLFVQEDITEKVREKLPEIQGNLDRLRHVLEDSREPSVDFCADCPKCAFWKYCSRNMPKPNVFDLPGLDGFNKNHKLKLYQAGCVTYSQAKDRPELKKWQKAAVDGELEGKSLIRKEEIRNFLDTLSFPMYYLDFEGINPVIPPYEGTWPYRKIPFQYSLHRQETEGGVLYHAEYLGNPETSPLRELAEHLCRDIPGDVCVLVYNCAYEKPVIEELARQFPDLAEHLMNIHGNIRDLMIPFRRLCYYLPAMQGSYSIKYVLPALYPDDPELDYHNLEDVHMGTEASAAFVRMAELPAEEREALRRNMLKYCELDTYAMVKVWQKLTEAAKD